MAILCGTDLSAASSSALEVACALGAMRGDTDVILVHVADVAANAEAELTRRRTELDAQAATANARSGSPKVRTELLVGSISELVAYADTEGADLLVIARGNRSGKIGTTAISIVAHTHAPVLCIADPAPWLAFARKETPLRVLVGIDDSATCDLSIQFTQALRRQGPLDIVLGAVYYPDEASSHYGVKADNIIDRLPEVEGLISRDLVRRFGGDQTHVAPRPVRGLGRVGDHLIELARAEKIDAIVVGTGQKTGIGRLGSVSSVIVQESPTSVICVPPQAAVRTLTVPLIKSALVATDLSQFANRAVSYAFSITPRDGTVHIVHVVDGTKDLTPAELAELERQLVELAPHEASQQVLAHVVHGAEPAEALAQTAARHGVDVLCISSHGRSGISRVFSGSVADKLLRATRLPVLVLRPS